jgi:hypothetical protein
VNNQKGVHHAETPWPFYQFWRNLRGRSISHKWAVNESQEKDEADLAQSKTFAPGKNKIAGKKTGVFE